MFRRGLIVAAGVLIGGGLLLAQPGVVVTRDGASYEGQVYEDEREVRVIIRGIETVIPRGDIVSIEYTGDYEAKFRERLAALEARDVRSRITLARDAFDQRRYDLAREALLDALRIDPNSRDATDMLDLVERQIRLERAGPAPSPAPATPRPPAPRPAAQTDRRLLTPEEINIIRQKELKPTDTGVRIMFQGDVKKRYAQSQNMTFAQFNRQAPVLQAMQIIEHGDEQMRQQVRIVSDPTALVDYKRSVQPLVLSFCATSGCHGGPGGGNLILYSPADSDAVSYTNFYILTQYEGRPAGTPTDSTFGSSMRRMIVRGQGERSLLANYGLPVNIADYDHPDVGGKPIQSAFRNRQDSRYQQVVNWMNNSLRPIAPDYGINFEPPSGIPATQPATGPAAEDGE